ncbi:glycoside hydrolase [Mucor mucedo]|uniref:glycoside hydrolase n=1 Tax=Mucor mucedo TaxID=29922 RepID=UPI0022207E8E|nr:glycoside hydrolase [Mucor mucedo]KAI7894397.1 glycoside hydrolase [Mucor mucedo]
MHGRTMISIFVTLCTLLMCSASASTVSFANTPAKKTDSASDIYGKHRLISYVVDWEIPETIKWDQMDHIAYAFAEPNESGELKSYTDSNLESLVTEAHKNKVGVSISVGGWSGSKYFSLLVSSDSKIKILVNNIMSMVEKFDLDGVNLDWEYPNDPNGVSCNIKNPKDTANYLVFVTALRKALDDKYTNVHKLLTLAVGTNPFNDEKQTPIKSLESGWAKAVDSFYLMTYDISGSWMKQAGPNAPLNKAGSEKYDSSVVQSVQAWKSAGIPSKQLVVGIPFYGASLKTSRAINSASGLYVKLASPSAIKGDQYDELSADACSGAKKSYSGSFQWRSIVSAGILDNKNGWKNYWDKVSTTPYAFLAKEKKFLSFDDPKSLKTKVDYINQQNLGGAMIWSLEMDDSKNSLLASIQKVRK